MKKDQESAHYYQRGRGSDASHRRDQALFQQLLAEHRALKRVSELLPNGIRVQTTSENPELAKVIQTHVEGMKIRFAHDRSIRSWDPLFIALFDYRHDIQMVYHNIPTGVEVVLTADEPKVIELIHAHNKTLHQFIDYGLEASQNPSPAPDWAKAEYGSA
ncbi:MAG TPA: hypothetical protein PLD79_00910 [Halothiobacillus sp.]|nr:MAG: hypothetical protein B7Z82_02340 [Halothiobacillus sp. 20-54-6]HQT42520.1 hypothetical protein [Halothiobacillus sp.]